MAKRAYLCRRIGASMARASRATQRCTSSALRTFVGIVVVAQAMWACSFDDVTGSSGGGASQGGGGGASQGGGGGASQGGGGNAPDWSEHFTAIYRFEVVGEPGIDDRQTADLDEGGTLPPEVVQDGGAREGNGYARFVPQENSNLTAKSSAWDIADKPGVTLGCWVRLVEGGTKHFLANYDAGPPERSYQLSLEETRPPTGLCAARGATDAGTETNVGSRRPAPIGDWLHLSCTVDLTQAGMVTTTMDVDGSRDTDSEAFDYQDHDEPLQMAGASGLHADLDECFVARWVATKGDVLRIRACGINGVGCECQDADPARYSRCGHASDNCDDLPPCNQAAPEGAL